MKKIFTLFVLLFISFSLHAQPTAEFTWCPTPDSTFQYCCIQFQNLSIDTTGSITGYYWDFGDGVISYLSDPCHYYSATANFIVYLYVYSSSGVDTVIHTVPISHLDTTGCNCDSLIGVNEISFGNYKFSLSPNPFHESTTLKWHESGNEKSNFDKVELRIYNSLGELVRCEQIKLQENQEIKIDRRKLSAGIYHFVLGTNDFRLARGKFAIE